MGGVYLVSSFTVLPAVYLQIMVVVCRSVKASIERRFAEFICGASCLQLGAVIFALRVPERWSPGAFDLFLSSHQLFHVCVVAAALVHYRGIHLMLDWRDNTGGCPKSEWQ